jgi:hypothetical protein
VADRAGGGDGVSALRKLVLGETWSLPLGVAVVLVCGLVLHAAFRDDRWWHDAGGFLLLAGVVATLLLSLRR